MKPPCVTVVKYLLPAIRVLVMKELIDKHSMRKIDASTKMDLTPAAITQYLKGKRGSTFIHEIEQSEDAMMMVSQLSEDLASDDARLEKILEKLCDICASIRSEGICNFSSKGSPSVKRM